MLNSTQAAYIRIELLIGTIIGGVVSGAFCIAIFGKASVITGNDIAFDAIPHSFMLTLMAILVPSQITKSRLRRGMIAPLTVERLPWLKRHLIIGSVATASAMTVVGYALHAILLPIVGPAVWPLWMLLAFKIAYGMIICLIIGRWVLKSAMSERKPAIQDCELEAENQPA